MAGTLKFFQFWLFLLYCTYLSLTPYPNEGLIETFSDKFLHCIGYFLLFISCNFAHRPNRHLRLKIILLLCYSAAIEIFQHFIPNRGFSFGDLLANLSGLLIGIFLLSLFLHLRGKVGLES